MNIKTLLHGAKNLLRKTCHVRIYKGRISPVFSVIYGVSFKSVLGLPWWRSG